MCFVALVLQIHTSFLTLPMYAIVKQMGEHYNVRCVLDLWGQGIVVVPGQRPPAASTVPVAV